MREKILNFSFFANFDSALDKGVGWCYNGYSPSDSFIIFIDRKE